MGSGAWIFLAWATGGSAALVFAFFAAWNVPPAKQVPPDAQGWSTWIERLGVPLALLVVLTFAMFRLAKWARPKADSLIDGMLSRANALPAVIEAQVQRDRAEEARDASLIAAVQNLSTLCAQLAERVNAQANRTQLVVEHVSTQVASLDAMRSAISQLSNSVLELSRNTPR